MKEFDIISIGGGSGGIATMNRAGEHGARAAVIEEKQLGAPVSTEDVCLKRLCGMVHKLQKLFAIMEQTMVLLLNRQNLILQP